MNASGRTREVRQARLADLCRRTVVHDYGPASVLVNERHEVLYCLGQLDHYLRIAPGPATHNLLAMAQPGLRPSLRAALRDALDTSARVTISGGHAGTTTRTPPFNIDVRPLFDEGERFLLVCFVPIGRFLPLHQNGLTSAELGIVDSLRIELAAAQDELQAALTSRDQSNEIQAVAHELALSANEEYQAINEELLTSKEELQSLNEALTALNVQMQEALSRQRTATNDLKNVLHSIDIATLFLDMQLRIRFFTPTTRTLFNIIPSDIGRPLEDLNALADDDTLLEEAKKVIADLQPSGREITAGYGRWYSRRVLPYFSGDLRVEGVVITFEDVTDRRQVARTLELSRQEAELANAAKTKFLAVASHDLRQPLQALTFLQDLLTKTVHENSAKRLVALMEPTLSSMTTVLNALLDINQIELGAITAKVVDVDIGPLLSRLQDEFAVMAAAYSLGFRVVPCECRIRTDVSLLEQMLRNLLTNAFKYTRNGKVLLGCRRRGSILSIEVWDTGIGIPGMQLRYIFDQHYRIAYRSTYRNSSLGLGLSIVKRLADVLGHQVSVRSHSGRGSTFSIDVEVSEVGVSTLETMTPTFGVGDILSTTPLSHHPASILVVEDDPDLLKLLGLLLEAEGHTATTAVSGPEALNLVARGKVRPNLILSDYTLSMGMSGLELAAKLRERLHREVPVIILTGDISTATKREIQANGCMQMLKPVASEAIAKLIRQLLPSNPSSGWPKIPAPVPNALGPPMVHIVENDRVILSPIREILHGAGHVVKSYPSGEAFLDTFQPGGEACLVVDAFLPGISGLELLQRLQDVGLELPSVVITGDGDIATAVRAMRSGAVDVLEQPVNASGLLECVEEALTLSRGSTNEAAQRQRAANHMLTLTPREHQVMTMILAGDANKKIAADLGISQRTVENHRASIMRKTGARSLPGLARLAIQAARL